MPISYEMDPLWIMIIDHKIDSRFYPGFSIINNRHPSYNFIIHIKSHDPILLPLIRDLEKFGNEWIDLFFYFGPKTKKQYGYDGVFYKECRFIKSDFNKIFSEIEKGDGYKMKFFYGEPLTVKNTNSFIKKRMKQNK